ncbi:hypothetical protein J14TS5_59400 [Paenibacillus lautus]|uniref:hypothetical protein n=1 Tax=Paenibacillus lautus TaxID=1401 RepID=UPI001B29EE1B|nr:hypothetical protein [Paenibacillus lautus]GIP00855.1 hypothetical protein J14TS5_59400 [Paenibacillus lautus]
MDSTDKGNTLICSKWCHSESDSDPFEFGKSHLKFHSYFPNSTATEKDTTCDTTADLFPVLSHPHRLPTAALIQGAATSFAT